MTFEQVKLLYRGFLKRPEESHCTLFGQMTEKQWNNRKTNLARAYQYIGPHPCCEVCAIMEKYGIRKSKHGNLFRVRRRDKQI